MLWFGGFRDRTLPKLLIDDHQVSYHKLERECVSPSSSLFCKTLRVCPNYKRMLILFWDIRWRSLLSSSRRSHLALAAHPASVS